MDALTELAPILGIQAPGDSLAVARAAVLACLRQERFPDQVPTAIPATLLDEGQSLGSVRTLYRVLEKQGRIAPAPPPTRASALPETRTAGHRTQPALELGHP